MMAVRRAFQSRYRFREPSGEIHVVERGAPAPDDGILQKSPSFFLFRVMRDYGARASMGNDREFNRLLDDLGLRGVQAGPRDAPPNEDRVCDLLRLGFDVYEVRRSRAIVYFDAKEEPVLGPDPSTKSAQPSKSWVGITLVDQDRTPVPNRAYRIILPDGTTQDGTLDSKGAAMIRDLDPGNCQIWCPYVEPHPEASHVVKDGDHISGIAQTFGFDDFTVVWNHAGNADLRSQRQDPHVLQPGDSVTIPELKARPAANKPTGAKHEFQIQQSPHRLRLKLYDLAGKPISNIPMTLAGASFTTDGDGIVEVAAFDKGAKDDALDSGSSKKALAIGSLNQSDDTSDAGYKARLFNMGFLWDDTVDEASEEMAIALEDFQDGYGLEVTGQLDDTTKSKILAIYGC
jgi:hypothetical protein